MPRAMVWQPVACPSEGFNAPIGEVCLQLWSGSRPCLRTLGGEAFKKKAFMEELGLEDVPCRMLVVVQRRPDGGWQRLGSASELARQDKRQQWQDVAPVPAVPGDARAAVLDLTAVQPAAAVPAEAGKNNKVIDLTDSPAQPAAAPAVPAVPPHPQVAAAMLDRFHPFREELPPAAQPAPAAAALPQHPQAQPVHPAVLRLPHHPAAELRQAPAAPAALRQPPAGPAMPQHLVPPAVGAAPHPPALPQAPPQPPAPGPPPRPVGGVPPAALALHQVLPVQHRGAPPPIELGALAREAHNQQAANRYPAERLPRAEVRPVQPAPAAPAAPAPQRSPAQPPAPALLAQARGSSARRRSLMACPTCKSVRRGAPADEAAEALTCPVCYCEIGPAEEHTHLDCRHPYCNPCLANCLHAAYQGGKHPKCQKPGCEQLFSEEDLQQGVLVLCGCPDVRQQRAAARLPPLDDALAAYERFNALAAAALAREGGDLIECQRCHYMILAEKDAPEDAPCPNCRRGQPLLEARQAAERPRGIQQVEGERVLFCPSCAFGPQQKAMYCNKLKCGGCGLLLCWCCGEAIGERRAYDHFADGKCPLYGLPGERPEMTAAEMEQAQERAVQREAFYQFIWDLIVHPAHDAVLGMRRATPPDMQADGGLWRRLRGVMHARLEQAFNEVTEAAAAREEQLTLQQLRAQLLPRAQALLDAAWRGWDVWEGVVGDVMRAVDRVLTATAQRMPPELARLAQAAGQQRGAQQAQQAQLHGAQQAQQHQQHHQQAVEGNAAPAEHQREQPVQRGPAAAGADLFGFAMAQQDLPLEGRLEQLMHWLQGRLVAG